MPDRSCHTVKKGRVGREFLFARGMGPGRAPRTIAGGKHRGQFGLRRSGIAFAKLANQVIAGAAARAQPVKRAGRPEDIAAAVAYLASDDAAFVTGTHILIDGGLTIGTRASWDENEPSLFSALEAFQ